LSSSLRWIRPHIHNSFQGIINLIILQVKCRFSSRLMLRVMAF
jgi:hypothetical protein